MTYNDKNLKCVAVLEREETGHDVLLFFCPHCKCRGKSVIHTLSDEYVRYDVRQNPDTTTLVGHLEQSRKFYRECLGLDETKKLTQKKIQSLKERQRCYDVRKSWYVYRATYSREMAREILLEIQQHNKRYEIVMKDIEKRGDKWREYIRQMMRVIMA